MWKHTGNSKLYNIGMGKCLSPTVVNNGSNFSRFKYVNCNDAPAINKVENRVQMNRQGKDLCLFTQTFRERIAGFFSCNSGDTTSQAHWNIKDVTFSNVRTHLPMEGYKFIIAVGTDAHENSDRICNTGSGDWYKTAGTQSRDAIAERGYLSGDCATDSKDYQVGLWPNINTGGLWYIAAVDKNNPSSEEYTIEYVCGKKSLTSVTPQHVYLHNHNRKAYLTANKSQDSARFLIKKTGSYGDTAGKQSYVIASKLNLGNSTLNNILGAVDNAGQAIVSAVTGNANFDTTGSIFMSYPDDCGLEDDRYVDFWNKKRYWRIISPTESELSNFIDMATVQKDVTQKKAGDPRSTIWRRSD